MSLPSDTLELLGRFRSEVWGNPSALKKKGDAEVDGGKIVFEYLDLGPHFDVLSLLCASLEPKLLVREEYINTYNHLVADWNGRKCKQRGRIVMGQPGIGKTLFLFYVLVKRLGECNPVALQVFPDSFLLFTEDTVTQHHAGAINSLLPFNGIWALSNSGDFVNEPALAFRAVWSAYVIQAASPRESRWKAWSKEHNAQLCVMDIWPNSELVALGTLLDLDVNKVLDFAGRWGPSPRLLIRLVCGMIKETRIQNLATTAARRLASYPSSVLTDLSNLDTSVSSSLVLFVRPAMDEHGMVERSDLMPWIPTAYLTCLISDELQHVDARTQAEFFNRMKSYPYSRAAAGWLFEGWVHTRFTMPPAVACEWLNSDLQLPVPSIHPADIVTGSQIRPRESSSSFYWQPPVSNFPAVDSVLSDRKAVYLIQATILPKHRVVDKELSEVQKRLPQSHKDLPKRLVFVAPDENTRNSLLMVKLSNAWKDINVGGCVITLSDTPQLRVSRHAFPGPSDADFSDVGPSDDDAMLVESD